MHLTNYQNTDVREEFQEIEKILASFSHLLSEEDRIHLRKHLIDGFGGMRRRDGTPYLNHLRNTLENFVKHFPYEISRTALLIALLHDSIEDTPENLDTIREKFGLEVAIGVFILSKRRQDDPTLLSENGKNIEYYTRFGGGIHSLAEFIQGELSKLPEDPQILQLLSNHDQYLKSKDTNEENTSPSIVLSLARIIAQIKLCDRLHNLNTLESESKKKEQYVETQKLRKVIDDIGGTIKEAINSILDNIFSGFTEEIRIEIGEILKNNSV